MKSDIDPNDPTAHIHTALLACSEAIEHARSKDPATAVANVGAAITSLGDLLGTILGVGDSPKSNLVNGAIEHVTAVSYTVPGDPFATVDNVLDRVRRALDGAAKGDEQAVVEAVGIRSAHVPTLHHLAYELLTRAAKNIYNAIPH